MPSEPFTLKEKVIILKATLLEIEELIHNTSIPLEQRKAELREIIKDELNDPSLEDRQAIFRMRHSLLRRR
jgi:hypothetical protein